MDLSVGEARDGGEAIFVGIIREITDRKAAELAQRESELRLRSVLDTVPNAIVAIDVQGVIQSFNPAAERLFGFESAEMIGHNVNMLMPAPYREAHDSYIERYLQTGERRIIGNGRVVTGRRKDGETFPVDYRSVSSLSRATDISPASYAISPSGKRPNAASRISRPSCFTFRGSASWGRWRRRWRTSSTSR
jgi:PAS domain S-box-containing protein